MKKILIAILITLIPVITYATPAYYSGSEVQYELINGKWYKVVHHFTDEKLIIYYFDPGNVPQGKYKLAGVEIFENGEIVKDTFKKMIKEGFDVKRRNKINRQNQN